MIEGIDPRSNLMDRLGFTAGLSLLLIYGFTVVAPYVFPTPAAPLMHAVEQTQNTTQNLLLMLYSFLYGTSVGSRMKDNAIAAIAGNAQTPAVPTNPTTGTTP